MARWDWRESLKGWGVDLALATAGGLLLGAMGPFGSYFNGPFWQRAAFQVGCFWLGTLLFGAVIRLLIPLRVRPAWVWWAMVAAVVVALTFPLAALTEAIARAAWPVVRRLTLVEWYLEGLVTALPVGLGLAFLIRYRARVRALRAEARAAPVAPAGGLLGVRPSEVFCLQMEDHYVRVHSASGSRLVLATLGQAIAGLEGAEGLQVHRSWWVARRAVTQAERDGRNLRLRLANGVRAPVARSAVAHLRAAGWLEGA